MSRRVLSVMLAVLFLVAPAGATWSIVVVDTATGEVAVGTATCLSGFDIQLAVPLVVVGKGGAAAQSAVDSGAVARMLMWDGLHGGVPPADILSAVLATVAAPQARQYGIVDMTNTPVTFTGTGAGVAKAGVAGSAGTLHYAIQGNVLAGNAVVSAARNALLTSPGDLSQKLMAAMEAARALGGDGRCSCSPSMPASCGAPPSGGFTKSAHTGTVIVARIGDADGICTGPAGCSNGSYYLDLNFPGTTGDPDPVLVLQQQYDVWRAGLAGRPDHILSTKAAGAAALPADGQAQTTVSVQLVDVDGVPLASGGATLTVTPTAGLVSAGAVTDHGDGSYSFAVTAGLATGTETLSIVADDGVVSATLHPPVTISLDPRAVLHAGFDELSASAGGSVPFTVDFGGAAAGAGYVMLGGVSGTLPGVPLGGGTLPLNVDVVTHLILASAGPPLLPGFVGTLDGGGRGQAAFVATPGLLAAGVGLHFDFAAVALAAPKTPSNAVGLDITP
ncbi:MAG: DUF1028 domain-containing protein [Planctomycetota bacterium]|jgi:uncharacterized Ntn-hydrolase superfamily protein